MKTVQIISNQYGNFILPEWDYISRRIAQGQFWDIQLKQYFDLFASDTVIDVGAHCGFHTIYLSKKAKRVIAFEPQKFIFFQLCGNCFLNNCCNIDTYNLALYDKECELNLSSVQLTESPQNADGTMNYENCSNSGAITLSVNDNVLSTSKISAVQLDQFNFSDVKLIKIDAQGSDGRIIEGAAETINRCRPVILFEYEPELSKFHQRKLANIIYFLEEECEYRVRKVLPVIFHLADGQNIMIENSDYVAYPSESKDYKTYDIESFDKTL